MVEHSQTTTKKFLASADKATTTHKCSSRCCPTYNNEKETKATGEFDSLKERLLCFRFVDISCSPPVCLYGQAVGAPRTQKFQPFSLLRLQSYRRCMEYRSEHNLTYLRLLSGVICLIIAIHDLSTLSLSPSLSQFLLKHKVKRDTNSQSDFYL